jgi:hypothetical protein
VGIDYKCKQIYPFLLSMFGTFTTADIPEEILENVDGRLARIRKQCSARL